MKAPAKVIPVFVFAVVCSAFVSGKLCAASVREAPHQHSGENVAFTGETRLPAEKSTSSYHKLTGNEPGTFVYETLQGISFHVTTEGLSSIRIGQRELASGGWSGMNIWEIYQWLVPGSQLIARLYQIEGDIPPNLEAVDRFYYRNRITPLVPVSDFRRLEKIEHIQPEFISDEGKWN